MFIVKCIINFLTKEQATTHFLISSITYPEETPSKINIIFIWWSINCILFLFNSKLLIITQGEHKRRPTRIMNITVFRLTKLRIEPQRRIPPQNLAVLVFAHDDGVALGTTELVVFLEGELVGRGFVEQLAGFEGLGEHFYQFKVEGLGVYYGGVGYALLLVY
jgi:hypothetical protein